ncbi:glycosyltransferase [Priestia megaterium]|uniref:glycosyltransferase n=1 Tax=Priestia megaterium TaxID=1404 RepID=UPI00215CED4F|nr:glycosyltransferase [Priestia megaterium]MED4217266.1 glycosyltransferase [Priestia megaterium]
MATYLTEVLKYQQSSEEISDVSVVLSDYEVNKNDYNYINSYFYNYVRKPKYFINAIRELSRIIKKETPDIIHVHSTFAGVFTRLLLIFKRKRPLVVYCSHGWSFTMDIPRWKKNVFGIIERLLAIKTDLIINISKNELNNSLFYKLPLNKSVVIYNGIKNKKSLSVSELPKLKLESSKINLLFIGRFDKQKGLDILIDFFSKNEFSNIKLYLIGDSVLNNSVLNLPNNMVSIGWVDNDMIDSYYEMFDAVIVPSRWEGFGLVAIEAMRNKKALLVSDRGALPEIVKDGLNGYIFNIDNYDELKSTLLKVSKEELMLMGQRGYDLYLDNFTSEKMNREIINQYSLLAKKKKHI